MRIYRRYKAEGKARWFFWGVYLIVILGVIKAIPWIAQSRRWDVLVLFASILIFVAWRALQGRNRL